LGGNNSLALLQMRPVDFFTKKQGKGIPCAVRRLDGACQFIRPLKSRSAA
jgi:hypothetical protein